MSTNIPKFWTAKKMVIYNLNLCADTLPWCFANMNLLPKLWFVNYFGRHWTVTYDIVSDRFPRLWMKEVGSPVGSLLREFTFRRIGSYFRVVFKKLGSQNDVGKVEKGEIDGQGHNLSIAWISFGLDLSLFRKGSVRLD